jgi:hypothetical protein
MRSECQRIYHTGLRPNNDSQIAGLVFYVEEDAPPINVDSPFAGKEEQKPPGHWEIE